MANKEAAWRAIEKLTLEEHAERVKRAAHNALTQAGTLDPRTGEPLQKEIRRLDPATVSDAEKPAVVKCKMGVHTPLLVGSTRTCACCRVSIATSAEEKLDYVLFSKITREMHHARLRKIRRMMPTETEMQRLGIEIDEFEHEEDDDDATINQTFAGYTFGR